MLFVVLGNVVMLTITVKQFYPACTIIRKNVCIGIVLRNSIFAKLLTSHPLICQDTIKQLQEELKSIEEADNLCISFTDWISSTHKSFAELTDSSEALDRVAMERKMKKLEVFIYFP